MSVNGASAIASEPTYIAPSPKPMASGEPRRAPINRLSSPANRKASAKAPRKRGDRRRAAFHLLGHQVRDDLGVGIGGEFDALGFELAPQLAEIFDDAVV